MSDEGLGCGVLVLIAAAAIGGAIGAYNGWFYTTGDQWYTACWAKMNGSRDWKTPVAPDAKTAIVWENCETTAQRAFYAEGMVFAGEPKGSASKRAAELKAVCPSTYSDLPLGGFYMLAVPLYQRAGGPKIYDRFLPAEKSLARLFKASWPRCSATREAQGYPTVIETSPGVFAWSAPCTVC